MDYNYDLVFQFKMDYNGRVLHIIVSGCFLIFRVWFSISKTFF